MHRSTPTIDPVAHRDAGGNHAHSVSRGERFEFGRNWQRFLDTLDAERISYAERSLATLLPAGALVGGRFLDVGSGSGLSSLSAIRLGATEVHSFDFDPASVACGLELRRRYAPDASNWLIEEGSVLDREYMHSLGQFDIVHSWGVLHHTGEMATALENVGSAVSRGGLLCLAIYNDQGQRSRLWRRVKKLYNRMPRVLRWPYVALVMAPREVGLALRHTAAGRPQNYVRIWTEYKRLRGMSRWHDFLDWVGGYPYEVAKPEEIIRFYRERGFVLEDLVTGGGYGNNEFVFRRTG